MATVSPGLAAAKFTPANMPGRPIKVVKSEVRATTYSLPSMRNCRTGWSVGERRARFTTTELLMPSGPFT